MALRISKVQVWSASILDQPGGLAKKLDVLAEAGANLEFVIARRAPEQPGSGVVFVTPVEGDDQIAAAKAAGFVVSESLHSVRIEGTDAPGLGAQISGALAEGGINLRGLSAAAIENRMVCYLALDTEEAANQAVNILSNL